MNFYDEYKKLLLSKPVSDVNGKSLENCAYCDYIYRSKNIYLSSYVTDSEDCFYSEYLLKARDCIDCTYVTGSELCYECTDCSGLYNCSYLENCHNCSATDFCLDCNNCIDCFGCFGLKHQQFRIFNKPYSEEIYREKVAQLKRNPPSKIIDVLRPEFDKLPRLSAWLYKAGGKSVGDYIYNSNNCHKCFNVSNCSNCAYVSDFLDSGNASGDSFDCDFCNKMESCYDCHACENCTNSNFLEHCIGVSDSEYMRFCYNCSNCFGCVYLQNKEFCILNRQFSRDEYILAVKKIKTELKEAKTYGQALNSF